MLTAHDILKQIWKKSEELTPKEYADFLSYLLTELEDTYDALDSTE